MAYDLVNKQIKLVKTAGYMTWIDDYTVADPAAAADPDDDGLGNIIEYVLGGDPSANSANLAPLAQSSDTDLVFTFQRTDASETTDIVLTAEASPDLVTWPEIFTIGADDATSSPGVHIEENAAAADTVTVTIPTSTAPQKYVRMKVRTAP
jgi:hypothetical protein